MLNTTVVQSAGGGAVFDSTINAAAITTINSVNAFITILTKKRKEIGEEGEIGRQLRERERERERAVVTCLLKHMEEHVGLQLGPPEKSKIN